ncbi:MAG: hypothetical protein Q9220_007659 [cf. Caloplaca sp. 1 TL-2023]
MSAESGILRHPSAPPAATDTSTCVPVLCPSTLSFLHAGNPYDVLSLVRDKKSPSTNTVKQRYRTAAKLFHPDKRSQHHLRDDISAGITRIYQDAAKTLLSPSERARWEKKEGFRDRIDVDWYDLWAGDGPDALLKGIREAACEKMMREKSRMKRKEKRENEFRRKKNGLSVEEDEIREGGDCDFGSGTDRLDGEEDSFADLVWDAEGLLIRWWTWWAGKFGGAIEGFWKFLVKRRANFWGFLARAVELAVGWLVV